MGCEGFGWNVKDLERWRIKTGGGWNVKGLGGGGGGAMNVTVGFVGLGRGRVCL